MIIQMDRKYWPYYLWSFGFVLLFFIAEMVNDRFWLNDFKVYFLSSKDFLAGESMYEHPYGLGSGYFKYSPFFAMLFSVFTVFYYKTAAVIFYWFIGGAIFFFLPLIGREVEEKPKRLMWILPFVFLFIADHLVRELHLGNVNFILLALTFLVYKCYQLKKIWLGSTLFAIIIVLKPYFMLLGLFFLLNKEWKWIIQTGIMVLICLLLPSLFVGFNANFELLQGWKEAMMSHNEEITSHNYLSGTLEKHFGIKISIFVFIFLFVAIYVALFFKGLKENSLTSFFLLIAIIPNLVLTDTEHFLYSIPLIVYLISHVKVKVNSIALIGLTGCVLYGLNWGFVWGGKTGEIVTSGIIGLGNLLIITSVVLLVFKSIKTGKE